MPHTPFVNHGLDHRESEKLDLVSSALGMMFADAGFRDVTSCTLVCEGDQRRLFFYRRTERLPLVVLTSEEFLTSTSGELRDLILGRLVAMKSRQ